MLRGYFARSLHYAAPDGGSSAAGGSTSGGAQTGGEPGSNTPSAPATGQAPAPASGDPPAPAAAAPAADKQFSQADVDRIVGERLAEEQRRNEKRSADASKKTKDDALKQAGEWQALAEQRGAELAGLQGVAEQRDAYAGALNAVIEAQIADWPKEVKALDPGKDKLTERIAWVQSAKALAERLQQTTPKAPNTEGGAGNRKPADVAGDRQQGATQTYRFQQPGDVTW